MASRKTQRQFNLIRGSVQEAFSESRNKVQIYGGGFANGKTASAVVLKILHIAKNYPGANILVARETYPKLNDTIRKEFLKWCPPSWIKSFPRSANASNTCVLKNGTEINFRYIQQQGKSGEEATTSNLLSATYDLIVIDQMEDPGIVHKDFLDLLGRLRGMARYIGDDPTMPRTGPRWFVATLNPTRNWCFRKIVLPLLKYQKTGIVDDDLLCVRYPTVLDDHITPHPQSGKFVPNAEGKPTILVDLFEASTYENADNLEQDYIASLESAYTGVMRDRFLLGKWEAYQGLVYPQYSDEIHLVTRRAAMQYFFDLHAQFLAPEIIEGYDYGMAVPFCYLIGFKDHYGNHFIVDGCYEAEVPLNKQAEMICQTRRRMLGEILPIKAVLADPQIFRRSPSGQKGVVGKTVAEMLREYYPHKNGLKFRRGNNDITNGILKVQGYLSVMPFHQHPLNYRVGAPHIYFADHLQFISTEISDYYWKRDPKGEVTDVPVDRNDHALDTLKYMLTDMPSVMEVEKETTPIPSYMQWQETELDEVEQNYA